MTVDAATAEQIQKLGLGPMVELYAIDMTPIGGPVLRYTPMSADTSTEALIAINFGGNAYAPFPISVEGFSWKAGESPATPTLSVGNIGNALTQHILDYNNLIGAQFTRIRTFEEFLDGASSADPAAHLPLDVFRFERKTVHNEKFVQWELSSPLDQQGAQLPKRLVTRDYCHLRYRDGSSGTFNYSKATCPYTGVDKFDSSDDTVALVSDDVCSHRLSGCKARFGASADLPFGGFPGIAKFRIR